MSDGLPPGWMEIELADHVYIAGRIGWRGLKAEEYTPSGPIFLSVPNLNHGDEVNFSKVYHISQERYDESPEIQLKIGDTLLVKDGAGIGKLGYVATLPGKATVNSSLLVVRPNDALLTTKFLFYYLKGPQFQQIALERISGSATPHLFQKDIKLLRVLVPPTAEQRRIVAQVEALLGKVRSSQERLDKVPTILKRFRQAVLVAACSGRLTADWREKNREQNSYPLGSQVTVEDPDSVEELPSSWRITDLGSMTALVTSGSRGWAKYYSDAGSVFIRAQNINSDVLDLEDIAYVRLPEGTEGVRTKVLEGDLLVTITGANVTKSALVDRRLNDAFVSQHVALVRLVDTRPSRFLYYFLISPADGRRQLLECAYGQGKPGLNLGNIRDVMVALPPVAEQEEIVRRVQELLVLADRLEVRYEKVKVQVDRLTQSVLAKAFRGELVPTEAELARREGRSYETAEELLARIRGSQQSAGSMRDTRSAGRKPRSRG